MNSPKTIQLFLPTGKPRGLKIAQVTSRIPIAIYIPRSDFSDACKRSELSRSGIYFLFGDVDDVKTSVYVGESENCLERLKQHNGDKEKEFNAAIVIVSKTNELTKCQIRYLEWLCCEEVKRIGRGHLLNRSFSQKPYVTEPVLADLMEMFETIALLLSLLDYPIFDPLVTSSSESVVFCRNGGVEARGIRVADGFVIFKDSKAKSDATQSARKGLLTIREQLKNSGVVKQEEEFLVFTSDHLFPSPSQAAGIVLGRSANGWTEWKDSKGVTLDQILRQDVEK
jgi:hypothetical protein